MSGTVINTRLPVSCSPERVAEIEGDLAEQLPSPAGLTFETPVMATRDPDTGGIRVDVGRCKDCKHWGVGYYSPHPQGHKVCEKLESVVDQDAGGSPPSSLATPGKFGCLLFEAKEES